MPGMQTRSNAVTIFSTGYEAIILPTSQGIRIGPVGEKRGQTNMRANAEPTIVEILKKSQESLPDWLASDAPPTFDRKKFFDSRTVYYPGSGIEDGGPVELYNRSHAAHTFLYVDQCFKWKMIDEHLSHRKSGFRGYEVVCRQPIAEDDLRPNGWSPHVSEQEVAGADKWAHTFTCPFGWFVVLKRTCGGKDHGPRRFAILFICGDGFAWYDALYCQRDNTPPPYTVVVQDHISGCNYDRFDRDGLLERVARRCNVQPKLLLVGNPSKPWTDYEDTGARRDCGTSKRRLFRRSPTSSCGRGHRGWTVSYIFRNRSPASGISRVAG